MHIKILIWHVGPLDATSTFAGPKIRIAKHGDDGNLCRQTQWIFAPWVTPPSWHEAPTWVVRTYFHVKLILYFEASEQGLKSQNANSNFWTESNAHLKHHNEWKWPPSRKGMILSPKRATAWMNKTFLALDCVDHEGAKPPTPHGKTAWKIGRKWASQGSSRFARGLLNERLHGQRTYILLNCAIKTFKN